MKIYLVKKGEDNTSKFYESLKANLNIYKKDEISFWSEDDLKAGEHVAAEKEKHLAEADVILFLVSAEIFSKINEYENTKHKTAKVIISACLWTENELLNQSKCLHDYKITYSSAADKNAFVLTCVTNLIALNE